MVRNYYTTTHIVCSFLICSDEGINSRHFLRLWALPIARSVIFLWCGLWSGGRKNAQSLCFTGGIGGVWNKVSPILRRGGETKPNISISSSYDKLTLIRIRRLRLRLRRLRRLASGVWRLKRFCLAVLPNLKR